MQALMSMLQGQQPNAGRFARPIGPQPSGMSEFPMGQNTEPQMGMSEAPKGMALMPKLFQGQVPPTPDQMIQNKTQGLIGQNKDQLQSINKFLQPSYQESLNEALLRAINFEGSAD